MFPLSVVGRSPLCSLLDSFHGGQKRVAYDRGADSIRQDSRLMETDPQGFQLWQTTRGRYWIPKGSEGALPILLSQQVYEIYRYSPSVGVPPGDVVLDCGAHITLFSRAALRAGAQLVVAIEPSRKNVEGLRRNLKDDIEAGRAVVFGGGVWDKRDRLILFSYDYSTAADSFVIHTDSVTNTYQAPVLPIDELVKELEIQPVDFIKMDIKGSTIRALEGAKDTLARWKPRMAISTEEEPDNPTTIKRFVLRLQLHDWLVC
jgi:FkbM family methyltransferase